MARTTKKKETAVPVVTRAEKKDAVKNLIKELLAVKPYRHNELLDEAAKLYAERFGGEDAENVNDVKGRIGSVLDIMKKDSDVGYDGGVYALKARLPIPTPAPTETPTLSEKPKKTRAKKTEKKEETPTEEPVEEREQTPKKTRAKKAKKTEEVKAETLAPVGEKSTPKKRGRKPKAETKTVQEEKTETLQAELPKAEEKEPPKAEEKTETPQEQPQPQENALVVKEKGEVAKKDVMDVTFLLGGTAKTPIKATSAPQAETPAKAEVVPQTEEKNPQENPAPASAPKLPVKAQEQPAKKQTSPVKRQAERKPTTVRVVARAEKPLTAEEKLRETFLKKLRSLGGDYFEYYSVYLLERYSMKNGRRLEGLKISGGDHDGGIDGEIELTDALGFKETIYIQSKNWNPEKGDEKLWVVGETLLQQFIGACACRQAKDGKQFCRGVFVTTSRFTPEAKRVLDTMGEKIIGYDGNDLFEAAKECSFGLVKRNGEWVLDEKLLSGAKAFFNMY